MSKYEEDSVFLPALNNENTAVQGDFAALKKEKFSSLNGAMLVMFNQDTVIYPKQTAWFQTLDDKGEVLPLNATDFYNNDYIGLKSLTEAGKVHYVSVEGNHLQFSEDDIQNTFIPFLNQ